MSLRLLSQTFEQFCPDLQATTKLVFTSTETELLGLFDSILINPSKDEVSIIMKPHQGQHFFTNLLQISNLLTN